MSPFTIRRGTSSDAAEAARVIGAALLDYGIVFDPAGRDADVALFGTRADHDDLVAEARGAERSEPSLLSGARGAEPPEQEDEGTVLGIASVGPHGDEGVAWISKVFVSRSARRRGIGRALLEAAHGAARARGYREVGLRTRIVFEEAIALYEAFGYARRDDPAAALANGDVVYYRRL